MRIFKVFLSLWVCLLFTGRLPAAIADYVIWKPFAHGPKLLLPVPQECTSEQFASKYLKELSKHRESAMGILLAKPRPTFQLGREHFSQIERLAPVGEAVQPTRMAIIANRFGHMLCNDPFPFVREKLEYAGAEVHVIPLSLQLVLSSEELQEVRAFIVSYYDALVATGGTDVHPELYGESVREARQVFREIDRMELSLLQEWLYKGEGALFGICRGHQLIAVMLGGGLVQDLDRECPQNIRHQALGVENKDQATASESAWHFIDLLDMDNALYQAVGRMRFRVNSRHHQALLFQQRDYLAGAKVSAVSGDVVEALELEGGRGFSVQFHPEDMNTPEGELIMKEMVKQAKKVRDKRIHYRSLSFRKAGIWPKVLGG